MFQGTVLKKKNENFSILVWEVLTKLHFSFHGLHRCSSFTNPSTLSTTLQSSRGRWSSSKSRSHKALLLLDFNEFCSLCCTLQEPERSEECAVCYKCQRGLKSVLYVTRARKVWRVCCTLQEPERSEECAVRYKSQRGLKSVPLKYYQLHKYSDIRNSHEMIKYHNMSYSVPKMDLRILQIRRL